MIRSDDLDEAMKPGRTLTMRKPASWCCLPNEVRYQ